MGYCQNQEQTSKEIGYSHHWTLKMSLDVFPGMLILH